jgi:hypothetical protein
MFRTLRLELEMHLSPDNLSNVRLHQNVYEMYSKVFLTENFDDDWLMEFLLSSNNSDSAAYCRLHMKCHICA